MRMVKKDDENGTTDRPLDLIKGKVDSLIAEPLQSHQIEGSSIDNETGPAVPSAEQLRTLEKEEGSGFKYDPEEIILSRKIKPSLFGLKGFSQVKVGLDIGSHAIKMVRLERGSKRHRLLSFGIVKVHPENRTQQAVEEAKVLAIKKLLKDINPKKSLVVTSLDDPSIVIRQIAMPKMSAKNLQQAIPFEARKHIPYEPAEVKLSYQILEEGKGRAATQEILLVAVPKVIFEAHLSVLRKANIEPYIVDVGPLALSNTYLDFQRLKKDETFVFLSIGASATTLNIYREGGYFFSRYISFSGGDFLKKIEKGPALESTEAEMIQGASQNFVGSKETVMSSSKTHNDTFQSASNRLLLETRRSLTFYDNKMDKKGFKKIVMSGGGARIKGIARFMEDELMIPVEVFNPFESMDVDGGIFPEDVLKELTSQMVLAVGLALRR